MAGAKGNSLRDRQIASLKKILNLNESVDYSEDDDPHANGLAPAGPILTANGEPIWKVLVFDELACDVISSVLRVNDLRSMGVTMHMHLTAARHPIPDVPVIYLVEPNAKNLEGITNDLQKGLYSPAYINFLSSIPRPLLEDFASQTAAAGTAEHIAQLFDQYLNFMVAEPDLFSLGMQKEHTYWALNSAKTKDEELDHVVDRIVSGLFSVAVTMGVIPIIRCPKGAAAEMIAAKLDRKLRDHILNSKDNLFSSNARPASSAGTPASRPVLVILDRNVDLNPMLSHSWTYQSLVHDVLNMKLNRITIETPVDEENAAKGVTKKAYDLTSTDFFWEKNAGVPFPQVAEDIDAELARYKEDAQEITKKTGASSIEDLQNDTSASAQHLKAAITLLPELRERKAVLDMHMNILASVLTGIKDRQLDNYFQMEENVMKQTKGQILEVIKDDNKGKDSLDKLRLFIIWFLSTEHEVSRADWAQFEEALTTAGAGTTSLAYIRQVRATTKMTQLTTIGPSQPAAAQSSSYDVFGRFSSLSSRLTDRLKETGVGVPTNLASNFDSLIGGIKNFLPANRDLTITKIVESIMDPQAASTSAIAKTENYLYFDPRSANARGTMPPPSVMRAAGGSASSGPAGAPGALPGAGGLGVQGPGTGASFGQRRQGFSEAVVFTVGGGSMDEYGNLQEWARRSGEGGGGGGGGRAAKRVVYGSTELLNAREFITEELERLGKEVL
ncbi:Sec1-like protein [Hypoxylon sp. NC1633]|nr:Sec1-like protein [Hypoxylon sp. NC1633]